MTVYELDSNKISARYSTEDKFSQQSALAKRQIVRQVAFVLSRTKSKTSPVIFTAVWNCSFARKRLDAMLLRPSRLQSLNVS